MTPEEIAKKALAEVEKIEKLIPVAIAEARLKALEEAAKIARAWIDNQSDIDLSNDPLGRGEGAALEIEKAIRERAGERDPKDSPPSNSTEIYEMTPNSIRQQMRWRKHWLFWWRLERMEPLQPSDHEAALGRRAPFKWVPVVGLGPSDSKPTQRVHREDL